ncbi:MAG: hypothetical protein AAGG46_04960, partial [Planctomycetota bacterium]
IDFGDRVVTADVTTESQPNGGGTPIEKHVFRYDLDLREEDFGTETNRYVYVTAIGLDSTGLKFSSRDSIRVYEPSVGGDFGLGAGPDSPPAVAAIPVLPGGGARLESSDFEGGPTIEADSYLVEFDYDQDGFADASELVDEFGSTNRFTFAHELVGFEPGETTLNVRVVGFATLANNEETAADGKWVEWTFTVSDPAPSVTEIGFAEPEADADGESATPTITGSISSPLPDAEVNGLYVEIDEDGDGEADGTAAVESTDDNSVYSFEYTLQDATPRELDLQVRAVDAGSGVSELVGDWYAAIDLELIDPDPPVVASVGLETFTTVGDAARASDPVIVGEVTFPSESIGRRVDFDHNGDGVADGSATVDAFGRFRYEPAGLSHGEQLIRLRVVDQVGDRVRGDGPDDWPTAGDQPVDDQSGVFRFFHDAVEAPVLNELRVVDAERGVVEGRATIGGYGERVSIRLEIIENTPGGSVFERSIETDSSGYFRYELPELSRGEHTVSVTPAADDPYGDEGVDGAPLSVGIDYQPAAVTTPAFTPGGPALVYASGTNLDGDPVVFDPTVEGTASVFSPQTYVEFSPSAGGDPIRVPVLDDGSFRFVPEGLGVGEHAYDAKLVSWNPDDAGNPWLTGVAQTIDFELQAASDQAPPITAFSLANNAAGPGETAQRSVEPLFEGRVGGPGYNGPVSGLPVYFDHNGDGVEDGVAYTRADGWFSYRTDAIEPG